MWSRLARPEGIVVVQDSLQLEGQSDSVVSSEHALCMILNYSAER